MRSFIYVLLVQLVLPILQGCVLAAERDEPVRAAHFVLAPSSPDAAAVPLRDALRILDAACNNGFNTVVVQIANSIKLDAAPKLTRRGAWEKQDMTTFLQRAETCNIDVVPELKLLTHQEKFFQEHYPNLMYNVVTYDPREDGVYDIVMPVLDEVIELMQPRAISIGHDEVIGWNRAHARKNLRDGESMLPADLFLADTLRLHGYLREKGVDTWMWGDMLFAPTEVPEMRASYLHGGPSGYGKAVRQQLPKDIVICDWHYVDQQAEFPTMTILQEEGFRVIGATWKKGDTIRQFSAYAAKHDAYGMMATIWFHVPLKEWDTVEQILSESGKHFATDASDDQ